MPAEGVASSGCERGADGGGGSEVEDALVTRLGIGMDIGAGAGADIGVENDVAMDAGGGCWWCIGGGGREPPTSPSSTGCFVGAAEPRLLP